MMAIPCPAQVDEPCINCGARPGDPCRWSRQQRKAFEHGVPEEALNDAFEPMRLVPRDCQNENPANPKQAFGDRKVPLALVPPASVIYEAEAMSIGADKYGPYNWRALPVEMMTYIHATLRHIYAVVDGEWLDQETGKPHIGHAKACMGIIADSHELGILIDNRPVPGRAGAMLRARLKSDA
jgi:hypothetical protein